MRRERTLYRYIFLGKKVQHFEQFLLQNPAVHGRISTFLRQEIFTDADGDLIDDSGILRGNAGAEIAYKWFQNITAPFGIITTEIHGFDIGVIALFLFREEVIIDIQKSEEVIAVFSKKEIVENIQRISKIVSKIRKLSKNIEFCFPRHSFCSIWKFKA